MKPRYRFTAFVLLIAFVLIVGIIAVKAQSKEIAADKKPVVAAPLSPDESFQLTDAEKTFNQQTVILDELNGKIFQAYLLKKQAEQQRDEVLKKYPGELILKNDKGVYVSHRPLTDEEKKGH